MEPAVYGPGGLQNRQLTDLEAYGPVGLQAEPLIATRAAGHGGLRTPLRPARRLSAAAYSQGCLKPLGLGGLQPIAGGPQPGRGGSAGAAPPPSEPLGGGGGLRARAQRGGVGARACAWGVHAGMQAVRVCARRQGHGCAPPSAHSAVQTRACTPLHAQARPAPPPAALLTSPGGSEEGPASAT